MSLIITAETLNQADISATDLRIEIAVYLYDKERLSFGQAKTLSGLDHLNFQKELSKRNVYIKYDTKDLEDDLKNMEEFKNKKAS